MNHENYKKENRMEKCSSCVHESACDSWITHCRMLYEDFDFSVEDCPYFRSREEGQYIKLEDLKKFPIRLDHYDKEHGNEHFVYGIETVFEYADYLPTYNVVSKSEVIDEFAKRLKEKLFSVPTVYNSHFGRMIDDILKEMKGGAKE